MEYLGVGDFGYLLQKESVCFRQPDSNILTVSLKNIPAHIGEYPFFTPRDGTTFFQKPRQTVDNCLKYVENLSVMGITSPISPLLKILPYIQTASNELFPPTFGVCLKKKISQQNYSPFFPR
ncbi:MAG: hypothetical protein U9O54_04225 [Chloroflexota bacterium]|nr:hypothetical protein [Chloroflexota bacterium]